MQRLQHRHDDALVISLNLANLLLQRMLVDTSSSADIIFLSALKEMGIENIKMENVQVSLVGFSDYEVARAVLLVLFHLILFELQLCELVSDHSTMAKGHLRKPSFSYCSRRWRLIFSIQHSLCKKCFYSS